MRTEGIDVLEDWFRWGEEWSCILRIYGGLRSDSNVLEIGCGLGRTAFPLRYALIGGGTYDGFEIAAEKVQFLRRTFEPTYPNFRFHRADVYNEICLARPRHWLPPNAPERDETGHRELANVLVPLSPHRTRCRLGGGHD
jgi:SAM-dependent methyltransferase